MVPRHYADKCETRLNGDSRITPLGGKHGEQNVEFGL